MLLSVGILAQFWPKPGIQAGRDASNPSPVVSQEAMAPKKDRYKWMTYQQLCAEYESKELRDYVIQRSEQVLASTGNEYDASQRYCQLSLIHI